MTGFYEGESNVATPVPHGLDGHEDVTVTNPLEGQILQYNEAQAKWLNVNDPSGSTPDLGLQDLNNVTDLYPPNDGEVIQWSTASGEWQYAASDPLSANLNNLLDVTITAPQDNDTLIYESGVWVNKPSSNALTNPLIVGDGSDASDASIILNAGTLAGDQGIVEFQENGNPYYRIDSNPSGATAILNIEAVEVTGVEQSVAILARPGDTTFERWTFRPTGVLETAIDGQIEFSSSTTTNKWQIGKDPALGASLLFDATETGDQSGFIFTTRPGDGTTTYSWSYRHDGFFTLPASVDYSTASDSAAVPKVWIVDNFAATAVKTGLSYGRLNSSNAATLGGSNDFAAVKNGTGVFDITFNTAATAIEAQSLVANAQGAVNYACLVENVTAVLVRVSVYDAAGVLADANISFQRTANIA